MQGGGLEGSAGWGVGVIVLQRERGEKQCLFVIERKELNILRKI